MDISEFQVINEQRAKRWHGNESREWTLAEWTNAMAGETGEACNIAKKLLRINNQLPNREAGISQINESALRQQLAEEVADSIIYGIIVLSKLNVDASNILQLVYNRKSVEYGFPERAPL